MEFTVAIFQTENYMQYSPLEARMFLQLQLAIFSVRIISKIVQTYTQIQVLLLKLLFLVRDQSTPRFQQTHKSTCQAWPQHSDEQRNCNSHNVCQHTNLNTFTARQIAQLNNSSDESINQHQFIRVQQQTANIDASTIDHLLRPNHFDLIVNKAKHELDSQCSAKDGETLLGVANETSSATSVLRLTVAVTKYGNP